MGANTNVKPASALASAVNAGDTQITVNNAGGTGLNYAVGEEVRIYDNTIFNAPIDFLMNDADTDATVTGNTVANLSAAASSVVAGAIAANNDAAKGLVENIDYVMDYENGNIRFLNTAKTPAGATIAVFGQYASRTNTRVNLGEFLPSLEMSLRLVHNFAGTDRKLTLVCPRVIVTPESGGLNFDESDWIGMELKIEVLASENPLDARNPFGYFEVDHNDEGQEDPLGADMYSVGSFELFLTPLNANSASARGFSTSEINVGCVRVGGVEITNEYLKHFCGTPRIKDKVVLLQKEITVNATVEHINTKNIALVFDGSLNQNTVVSGYQEFAAIVTVPDNIATPEGQATPVPLRYVKLDPN